ncbi:hypothetical protein QMZ92_19595 [Streptomyces sp. HNM0645]|uniref:hypothetical protein n=1 Tax=Streptomyces sp. HNM0645 TaxID=2782343 RepID=UPI0024B8224C|nr:hypothetical protein [Streptomyces sp. HNM0645]MDI9886519.1 hypothetical protein [Streptomyces sp. HNM0645]
MPTFIRRQLTASARALLPAAALALLAALSTGAVLAAPCEKGGEIHSRHLQHSAGWD